MQALKNDVRQEKPRSMLTRPQLRSQRTAEDFYDFLFGLDYLEPQYALKMEGTVHEILVPSIKLAKQRRQIIIVTHNPNLAVVADADQVIAASIDKQKMCKVKYESGALENPTVNQHVARYLEGTLPAFMNRDEKYIRAIQKSEV